MDPAAPLIPLPQRPATVLPAQAPERQANGFANILADPTPVAGVPRSEATRAAGRASLAQEGRAAQAETSRLPPASFAGALRERSRDHVADARRAIEATGRDSDGVRDVPAAAAIPTPTLGATPLDPGIAPPRKVGTPAIPAPDEPAPSR